MTVKAKVLVYSLVLAAAAVQTTVQSSQRELKAKKKCGPRFFSAFMHPLELPTSHTFGVKIKFSVIMSPISVTTSPMTSRPSVLEPLQDVYL